jgi:hypothetical protein
MCHDWGTSLLCHTYCCVSLACRILLKVDFANHVSNSRWNFTFPTPAERVAWRVFSLITIGASWPVFLIYMLPLTISLVVSRFNLSVPKLKGYIDPESRLGLIEISMYFGWLLVYSWARMGMLILVLISMRALPAGSYVGIDWLSTIPHV